MQTSYVGDIVNISEKQQSAQLILQLYDLRREEKMRQSRDWWFLFSPKSVEDIHKAMASPDSWKMRQAVGYWETAAAIVNNGAIDETMFHESNGEFLLLYVKVQPFLAELRKSDPRLLVQVEKLIMHMPDHEKKLEGVRQMLARFGM
jgi:hypothetical protein